MSSDWARWFEPGGFELARFLDALEEEFTSRQYALAQEDLRQFWLDRVVRNRWDMPGRTYVYGSQEDPTSRTVQLQLTGSEPHYSAFLGGAAWADLPADSPPLVIRYWCHTTAPRRGARYFRLGALPHDASFFESAKTTQVERVLQSMSELLRLVASWRFDPEEHSWSGDGLVEEAPVELRHRSASDQG